MSNIINGWLGGSVVPACGRGYAAAAAEQGLGAAFPAAMGSVDFSAGTPTRTRGTDVTAAVKATHGAFWATKGRPAWSPPTT